MFLLQDCMCKLPNTLCQTAFYELYRLHNRMSGIWPTVFVLRWQLCFLRLQWTNCFASWTSVVVWLSCRWSTISVRRLPSKDCTNYPLLDNEKDSFMYWYVWVRIYAIHHKRGSGGGHCNDIVCLFHLGTIWKWIHCELSSLFATVVASWCIHLQWPLICQCQFI